MNSGAVVTEAEKPVNDASKVLVDCCRNAEVLVGKTIVVGVAGLVAVGRSVGALVDVAVAVVVNVKVLVFVEGTSVNVAVGVSVCVGVMVLVGGSVGGAFVGASVSVGSTAANVGVGESRPRIAGSPPAINAAMIGISTAPTTHFQSKRHLRARWIDWISRSMSR